MEKIQVKTKEELILLINDTINKEGNRCDLNFIDTSLIIDMYRLFSHSSFNGDISRWNTSNVKDMSFMFTNSEFNGDISKWDVSNVIDFGDFGLYNDSHLPIKFRNLDPCKEYIGWKQLRNNKICKLRIPVSAIKCKGETGKCRCNEAEVLEITGKDDCSINYKEGHSIYDYYFKYEVGKVVKSEEEFDRDRWDTCSCGIHFFLTREEAIRYK